LAHAEYEVRIFSVSENGENGLGDEGADGDNAPPPRNFWARTAPGSTSYLRDVITWRKGAIYGNTKVLGANYKKILRLSYDVIITYDNRKSNLR